MIPNYARPMSPTEEAQTYIQPMFNNARQDLESWMTNKGLMNSSIGANHYATLVGNMANQQSLTAQDLYRNSRDFYENQRKWNLQQDASQRQWGADFNAKLWEMLTAKELQKAQLPEIPKWMRLPKDPVMFKQVYGQGYQPINFYSQGPYGDPIEQYPRYSPKAWKSTGLLLQEAAGGRDAARLKLEQNADARAGRANKKKETDDEAAFRKALWELVWTPRTDAQGNQLLGPDGRPQYQNNYEVIKTFTAASQRDLDNYRDILRPDLKNSWIGETYHPYPNREGFDIPLPPDQAPVETSRFPGVGVHHRLQLPSYAGISSPLPTFLNRHR